MSLMFEPLRKYATFSGRARRTEYWLWQLFMTLVAMALVVWLAATMPLAMGKMTPDEFEAAMAAQGGAPAALWALTIFSLAIFLPSLAVTVRRLHDSDKSGWWLLIGLTGIGGIVLLIFYLLDGTKGPNRHGPDPKNRPAPPYS